MLNQVQHYGGGDDEDTEVVGAIEAVGDRCRSTKYEITKPLAAGDLPP
jgi:hypothetical protein